MLTLFLGIFYNLFMGDREAERTRALVATHNDAGSKLRPRVAFFFGQVTVSREQCRHPPTGHGRYLRVPTKTSVKLCKTCLNLQYPPTQLKTTQWPKLLRVNK